MEWPRIKNIIILILLATNVCLLGMVLNRQYQDINQQRQARANVIALLEQWGIEARDEVVPTEITLQEWQLSRDLESEKQMAKRLLGDAVGENFGGEIVLYTGEMGTMQFHSSGEFNAEFVPGTMALNGKLPSEHGAQLMRAIGMTMAEDTIISEGDGETCVTFTQMLDGIPVSNCQVTLVYRDGCLAEMRGGRRLPAAPVANTAVQTISVPTALVTFLNMLNQRGDVCSVVQNITPFYLLNSTAGDGLRLTPMWRIQTDTGAYQLDLVRGALNRLT